MKPGTVGALAGAMAGFLAVLLLNLALVRSSTLRAILFPGRIFIVASNGMGMFGHMVFDTLAYLVNILLYAAIGYGVGRVVAGSRRT